MLCPTPLVSVALRQRNLGRLNRLHDIRPVVLKLECLALPQQDVAVRRSAGQPENAASHRDLFELLGPFQANDVMAFQMTRFRSRAGRAFGGRSKLSRAGGQSKQAWQQFVFHNLTVARVLPLHRYSSGDSLL